MIVESISKVINHREIKMLLYPDMREESITNFLVRITSNIKQTRCVIFTVVLEQRKATKQADQLPKL